MPKLLWVALPVALAVAWVVVQALRGQMPSRLALNVVFSLLLAGYVIGTAALGIFWVANQQLSVFDWHYLFGCMTAVLAAVHLAFNWRVVWRFLRSRRTPPPLPSEATSPLAEGAGDSDSRSPSSRSRSSHDAGGTRPRLRPGGLT